MTLGTTFQDTRAVFDFGKQALAEGHSLGEIERQLISEYEASRYLVDRALPLLAAYSNAQILGQMSYRTWISRLSKDLFSAGTAGAWLAAFMIPAGLILSYWVVSLVGLEEAPRSLLAPILAVLCVPMAWIAGWPVFVISRMYWRLQVRRIDSMDDLDSIDTTRLPRSQYFD